MQRQIKFLLERSHIRLRLPACTNRWLDSSTDADAARGPLGQGWTDVYAEPMPTLSSRLRDVYILRHAGCTASLYVTTYMAETYMQTEWHCAV